MDTTSSTSASTMKMHNSGGFQLLLSLPCPTFHHEPLLLPSMLLVARSCVTGTNNANQEAKYKQYESS
jgi:hypothetical protein